MFLIGARIIFHAFKFYHDNQMHAKVKYNWHAIVDVIENPVAFSLPTLQLGQFAIYLDLLTSESQMYINRLCQHFRTLARN